MSFRVESFTYVENLTNKQLKEIEGRCVLVDPGRRDILYCIKESSTVNDRRLFRFTKNQRDKKFRRLRYLRNKLKPECIKLAERQLSELSSKTLDFETFVKYLKARRLMEAVLKTYYSNETLTETPKYHPDPLDFVVEEKGDIYYGERLLFIMRVTDARPGTADLVEYIKYLTLLISTEHLSQRLTNQDIDQVKNIIKNVSVWLNKENRSEGELEDKKIEMKHETHQILSKLLLLPFRKLKFASKIYNDKCDIKLAKNLKESFGQDSILIVGDWSAPNAKFHVTFFEKKQISRLLDSRV